MMDRACIAIECHQFAAARFARTGADDDCELMAQAFARLASAADTSGGAAAVAAYVAGLQLPTLPDGWLVTFLRTIARCARKGGAASA